LIGGDKQKKMDQEKDSQSDYSSDSEMMEGDEFINESSSQEEGDEEMNEQNFQEDSASDDEKFFEKQTKKKEKTKKIEFEEQETKEKFLKSLNSILSENKDSILNKKTKLVLANQKLIEKQNKEFQKSMEDKKIFDKDHKLPDRTTLTKEAKLRAVETSGVVALFSAVQKSKKAEKKKEEVASGYTVLKNSMADKKSKWNVLTDEIIEDDNFE
jgi:hypothetical protein